MSGRIPCVVALLALVCACSDRACSDGPPRVRDVGLEAFEAPYFEDQQGEVRYLSAQYHRVTNDWSHFLDVNFDSEIHVLTQHQELIGDMAELDLHENHPEVIERDLAATPEVMRFRGVRQNIVALGLMAYSIWRRDLEPERASIEELRFCMRMRLGKRKCRLSARARYLHRAMLTAEYADKDLYEKLKRQMPPLRRRIPRPPVNKDFPDVETQ